MYYAYGENCCVTFNGTTKADREWYNQNFGEWTLFPLFSREEAQRLGLMENGREIEGV
ncbi:hypothetical protein AB0395_29530 [Streptosporangium sp. NPDC051023]|uniref:hypothetical protein n=1 Tax=Streptosporangium sp. NPDC051023 TaxID=3155410 RepID=UPI00344BE87F